MALKGRTGRATLSDRLRGMRFMREREDANLKEKQAKELKQREEAARWVINDPEAENDFSTIVIVDDAGGPASALDPVVGARPESDDGDPPLAARQSYGEFNVAVERRMQAVQNPQSTPKKEIKLEGSADDNDNADERVKTETKEEAQDFIAMTSDAHSSPSAPPQRVVARLAHAPPHQQRDGFNARHRPAQPRRDHSLGPGPRRGKRSYSGSQNFNNSRKKFKSSGNNRPLFKR